jgi:hypothetical protein
MAASLGVGQLKQWVQLWDTRQPVESLSEDIVGIHYQETTSESSLRTLSVCSSVLWSRHYFADSGGRSVGIVRLRTKTTEF